MFTDWLLGMSLPAGIALLLWSLARDVRREDQRPGHWWQNKKRRKKYRPVISSGIPAVPPGLSLTPTSQHCGGHHYGGGSDCGGF
jgi:hypothetical protein